MSHSATPLGPMIDPLPPHRRLKKRRRPPLSREQRSLRLRRHGRRADIRSVYFLPSIATLGNAVCGFAAIYVAPMVSPGAPLPRDPVGSFFVARGFGAAAYLI